MSGRRQYLLNVAWSWGGSIALILNGVFVSPYIIRRLGSEQYGIWSLGLSLVEYFWMIDLGLRPATVKLGAEYRALENWDALNQVLSTAIAYSAVMGSLILLGISFSTHRIAGFFHINNPSFPVLIQVVSFSWAFGLVFNIFAAGMEGFQRFDISNRIFIAFLIARNAVMVTIVALGYGLTIMSLGLLITQSAMYIGYYVSFRRLYPEMRLSPRLVTKEAGKRLWGFAGQTVSGLLSARVLQSAIPSLIARFLPIQNLTYYNVPQKMIDYASEGIGRLGLVTAPRASEWMARGMRPQIINMAEYGNKYCLSIWLVCGTFLLVYGKPLCKVWINAEFAEQAGILLPFMIFGQTLFLGQFISAAILMGIGRYAEYSASLMIEALLTVLGYALALQHYGLVGGVAIGSVMMFLNRCINLSRIFAKEFHISQIRYLWKIYSIPLGLAALDVLALWAIRNSWAPGRSFPELVAVGMVHSILFGIGIFSLVLEPDHRAMVLETAAGWRKRAELWSNSRKAA